MILKVAPTVLPALRLTRISRWTLGANRGLGADGLCIAAQGLTINYETLLRMSLDRVSAAHERASPQAR